MKWICPMTSPFSNHRDLTLANHVHRLVAVDRSQRSFHRTKPETGGDSLLNEPVVLLKNIVEIRGWSTSAAATQLAAVLQFRDGAESTYGCSRWMRETARMP